MIDEHQSDVQFSSMCLDSLMSRDVLRLQDSHHTCVLQILNSNLLYTRYIYICRFLSQEKTSHTFSHIYMWTWLETMACQRRVCEIQGYHVGLKFDCYWQILSCQGEVGNINHSSLLWSETTWSLHCHDFSIGKTIGFGHLAQDKCSISKCMAKTSRE